MSDARPVILWFRRDLRLADNPALQAAVRAGAPVVPLYVLDETPGLRAPGAASLWWLDKSLASLAAGLAGIGSGLVLRRGRAELVVQDLAREVDAQGVIWNAIFEPRVPERDADLAQALKDQGVEPHRFNGGHLVDPHQVRTKADGPYSVFTPFWRAARALVVEAPEIPAPARLDPPSAWPASERLADWALHPQAPDWSAGFGDWRPGEAGAAARLAAFVQGPLAHYERDRDRPGVAGTSRLSPHLHFGEISPKACWRAARAAKAPAAEIDKFLAELGWREFCAAISARGRDLAQDNFDRRFDAFPWRQAPAELEAWRRGRTGFPIVDAGMRELWATGFMHNRVRMICASFLTKHLLIHWREGEAWFWDALVDADHASNAGNWQWVAGSGADAAPYFRIFNPMAQGEKFDPDGVYVRRWVPELARLKGEAIHAPWTAASEALDRAGVRLGQTYPRPVVDHAEARTRALAAYAQMRAEAQDDVRTAVPGDGGGAPGGR
jgi:deoxyribodipyrimidine photo-lyase